MPTLYFHIFAVFFITARKRSLGQGNKFTGVCLSTGGVSQHALRQTPRDQTPPSTRYPPSTRHPPGTRPPRTRPPPGPDPPGPDPPGPPSPIFFLPYGQHAGGTHPTGMHSSYLDLNMLVNVKKNFLNFEWHSHNEVSNIVLWRECENPFIQKFYF